MPILTRSDYDHFRKYGYLIREDLLTQSESKDFLGLFDSDRKEHRYRWHPYGYRQHVSYDALVTTLDFDRVLRHPKILGAIEELMGGPTCFGELGARYMGPYDGETHQSWHRDRPHWPDHPYRMDYIQLMLYLTDVNKTTHCFSLSPESIDDPILNDKQAQLDRGGCTHIYGPAGTICLFNIAVLHTATTRPTKAERKTLQAYYGHRDRPFLANDSIIPPLFWKNHPDPEVRAFYGNLNTVTRTYAKSFGIETLDELS